MKDGGLSEAEFQKKLGTVVLEALAAGLPVVVSDGVGCHPDIVVDSRVGHVTRHENTEELANAMLVTATETTTSEDITVLVEILKEVLA